MTDTENFASLLSDIIEMRIRTIYSAQPQNTSGNAQQYPYSFQSAESAPRSEYQYPSQPQTPRAEYARPAQPQETRTEYSYPSQQQAPRSEYAPTIQQHQARAEQVPPPPVQSPANAPAVANQQKIANVKDFARNEADRQKNADSSTEKAQIIDFSLDDDDSSPTPPRDFDD